jgi:hypothetical protein
MTPFVSGLREGSPSTPHNVAVFAAFPLQAASSEGCIFFRCN